MKFFTRELYLRYNGPDKTDRADAEWEAAVTAYHTHLGRFSATMNDRVRKFAEDLCLHDAELLALHEDVVTLPTLPPMQTPVAILSLRAIGRTFNLSYLLWGELVLSTAAVAWPSSPRRVQWLYDEIDREPSQPHRFYHHVMLSDGRELSIPFDDVIVHSYSDRSL
jgi:hypothetical protein